MDGLQSAASERDAVLARLHGLLLMDYCCTWRARRRPAGLDGCALAVLTVMTWPGKRPLTP